MTEPKPDDPIESTRMTLGEHLEELRARLVRSAAALVLVFVVAYAFSEPVTRFVEAPLQRAVRMLNEDLVDIYEGRLEADPDLERADFFDPPGSQRLAEPIPRTLRGDAAQSGFFYTLKVCVILALGVAGPYMLWQLWQFVAAGLYAHERKVVYRYVPASFALFAAGVVFGYTVLVPYGYYFLSRTTLGHIRHDPEVGVYLSFVLALCLALGVVFQLPVVMMALARIDLVQPAAFRKYRPHFIVGALFASALLTPPDPITQGMMGVPMLLLYELGILLAVWASRRRPAPPAEAAP